MKLDAKEFKRFKELSAKNKAGKCSSEEQAELDALTAKRNVKGSNDVAWYKNYPELAKGATNVPFNYIPGTTLELEHPTSNAVTPLEFAGVLKFGYYPTIGKSITASDPFNAQMRQLWLDMHRKYRGMGGYQRSDLGMAILAIIDVFGTVAKCERIYGTLNSYKVLNRNVPYTLFDALQIDRNFESSMADFRYRLNVRIEKMKQLCLPKGIAALEERVKLNAFIFKDAASNRASLFFYDPIVFGVYDPQSYATGGAVNFVEYQSLFTGVTPGSVSAPGATPNDLINILDQQLKVLLEDDDIAKMCSDIIAAYGSENVSTIGYLPEDWRIEPVLDYERSVQMHNTIIIPGVRGKYDTSVIPANVANTLSGSSNTPYVIYQKDDIIMSEFTCSYNSSSAYIDATDGSTVYGYSGAGSQLLGLAGKMILDTWVDNPSEVEILCGTRFSVLCNKQTSASDAGGTTKYFQEVEAFGAEIVTECSLYTRDHNVVLNNKIETSTYKGTGAQIISAARTIVLNKFVQFDWHPILYFFDLNGTNTLSIMGDVDNLTGLTQEMLRRLHETAIYSMFKIPNVSYIQ